jgi:hypothetical protein
MQDRTLYSIQESRRLLGGISRNMIYQLLRTGRLASVVIGSRRFISAEAIADLIERSTTTVSPSLRATRRSAAPEQITLPLRLPSSVRARVGAGQAVKSPDLARQYETKRRARVTSGRFAHHSERTRMAAGPPSG